VIVKERRRQLPSTTAKARSNHNLKRIAGSAANKRTGETGGFKGIFFYILVQVQMLTLLGGTRKVIYIANQFKVVEDIIERIPLKQKFWDGFCVYCLYFFIRSIVLRLPQKASITDGQT
jgi:hypothetical protein